MLCALLHKVSRHQNYVHSGTAPFGGDAYPSPMQLVTDVAMDEPSPDHVRAHPGDTSMTNPTAVISDVEAGVRWRDWQAKGAARDRRTATRMRRLMFLIVAALAGWFFVQVA
jgi:hypothetical protein